MKIGPALMGAAAALALAGCARPAQESGATNAAAGENGVAAAPDNGAAANAAAAPPVAPVAAAPAPAPSATADAGQPETAAALPVPFGRYAVDQSCADAAAGDDYLGLSPDNWSEIDGDTPIGPFRNVGGDRWALGHGSGLTITVTGPRSFTENGRRMTWCKA